MSCHDFKKQKLIVKYIYIHLFSMKQIVSEDTNMCIFLSPRNLSETSSTALTASCNSKIAFQRNRVLCGVGNRK